MLQTQRELVKSTLPALREHGETITHLFYTQMLEAHPELRTMFNAHDQESGEQAKRLAMAILAYVGNIDHLDLLGPAVTSISKRHVQAHVTADQYPIVGHYLLGAIKQVLGNAATPEILSAWTTAYQELADIMIDRERVMYAQVPMQILKT